MGMLASLREVKTVHKDCFRYYFDQHAPFDWMSDGAFERCFKKIVDNPGLLQQLEEYLALMHIELVGGEEGGVGGF